MDEEARDVLKWSKEELMRRWDNGTPVTLTTASNAVVMYSELKYANPFKRQPWRFLWWLDDWGHRRMSRKAHRRALGWVCDGLDRKFW